MRKFLTQEDDYREFRVATEKQNYKHMKNIEHLFENNQLKVSYLLSSLLFLFFIQQITFLVESIYMVGLVHHVDNKVLGLLLLTMPILLLFIKQSKFNYIVSVSSMLFCILMSPILPTPFRIFSSGFGAGLFLLYLALQITDKNMPTVNWGQAAALATLISITFRAAGHSLDISLNGNTKFVGWILMMIVVLLFYQIIKKYPIPEKISIQEENNINYTVTWLSILGLFGSVLLIYFAFSSPSVIARWTDGNYIFITIVLCTSIYIFLVFGLEKILNFSKPKQLLVSWNSAFLLLLILNIIFNRVYFPISVDSKSVVIGEGHIIIRLIIYLMLILSPIIFVDIAVFISKIKHQNSSKLAFPFIAGSLLFIICIIMLIFTNVWGYFKPVSSIFRNQFHLPFVLAGIFMIIPYFFMKIYKYDLQFPVRNLQLIVVLAFFFVVICCGSVFISSKKQVTLNSKYINKLTVMTYNIQQGVDFFGNKNYMDQLALIVKVDPDIICLQESDGSRISGGNSDIVRYFSEKLGYYSYYGPKTVTGTFGTAILSRFSLDSCRTIFSYSNVDEVGTSVASISVGNRNITIINSHPDGNGDVMDAHINEVIRLTKEKKMVIAPGDYNFTQNSLYYKKITNILNEAWLSMYPDTIDPNDNNKLNLTFKNRKTISDILSDKKKLEMSSRIDHIFLSKEFNVLEAYYLPAPESGTDHPALWAVVSWN